VSTNFKVMTWNVENLFKVGNQYGPPSKVIYEHKMMHLATTILGIRPDVLAVQEIGDPEVFADLQGRLNGYYSYTRLAEHHDDRGIRVGFLSHLPFNGDVIELFEFPDESMRDVDNSQGEPIQTMGRGAVKVTVEISGLPIHLVTAHLKSKLITYPGGRRTPHDENERTRETGYALLRRIAEAAAVRVYINQLMTNNNDACILMGDLNDIPSAVTTELLLGPEDLSLSRPDKGDDVRLYNLAEYIPAERRYSRIYHKKRELIDHIMVSHELIFRLQKIDSCIEHIESIGPQVEPRRSAIVPDHAPVYAEFQIG
jgi:endonuclease/exonuclease/phosphatase family metal-dependent hydrolase